jgi:hypothetical protein
MTAVIVALTCVLAILTVLVVGLLRSHATILATLKDLQERRERTIASASTGEELAPGVPTPSAGEESPPASDIAGTTPYGDAVQVSFTTGGASSLIAFLSSGCTTCQAFWEELHPAQGAEIPGGARVVVVTKSPEQESVAKLRELAPPELPVIMSSQAWEAYEVPGSPYFVHIDGASGRVSGEGSASSWKQVRSLLQDALLETGVASDVPSGTYESARARAMRAERELAAAGLSPDDPSLYEFSPSELTSP